MDRYEYWKSPVLFHDFINFRAKVRRHGPGSGIVPRPYIEKANGEDLETFYRFVGSSAWDSAVNAKKLGDTVGFDGAFAVYSTCVSELRWLKDKRPFVNVWPIVTELLPTVTLRLKWSDIVWPHETMVFRFAKGHEPHSLSSLIVSNVRRVLDATSLEMSEQMGFLGGDVKASLIHALNVDAQFVGDKFGPWLHTFSICCTRDGTHADYVDDTLRACLASTTDESGRTYKDFNDTLPFICQLAVFTALAWSGEDLVTPLLLKKDRPQWSTADDEARQWMLQRAERLIGRGVDLGRVQEENRNHSPHWRNPHLCLFWTGPNRETPVIKIRKGAIVSRQPLVSVPTGYIGEETTEERELDARCLVRVAISKTKRFEIFRRDGYRCQLCGATAQSGVAMHIDHRIPVSKGGTNEDDNLWLLCEPCNLGKSANDL